MSTALSPVQFGNPYAGLAGANFTQALQAKLPSGDAWDGPVLQGLLAGCGDAFGDLHARAATLSEVETDPTQTTELLPFWEADYGLPDCCTPLGATIPQRRGALNAKIAQIGGQSAAYFTAVARALGWTITITQGALGTFEWTVHAAEQSPPVYFQAGIAVAGDALVTVGSNDGLECVIEQIAPAHAVLNFAYS